MHSMRPIDGKESNTAKEVNIKTKFNEFIDTLFNKKIDTKWNGLKLNNIKLEHIKSTKYHYLFLMIKYLFK